jgi:pyruvate-formate lyase-activating enzyme
MTPKMGCNAPWYEMNISAADDYVSPCCYYSGKKDAWSDEFRTVQDYWNSPNLQAARRVNSEPNDGTSNGCSGCYFFKYKSDDAANYFSSFMTPYTELSDAQRANWLLAIDDYKSGRTEVRSTPLRYYVNFGFACNLYCTMCHQVPRRKTLKRRVQSDILLKWKEDMKSALNISVIGGEPFVMKEAVEFIRQVILDPDFEAVQLSIFTNGTMHHKHMDLLSQKRKLQFGISLDTIGDAYEKIRVGASWKKVEKNILDLLDTSRKLGYDWNVFTPCMLLKTNVPNLVDFVDWTIKHGIHPGFYDFINARGIEKTFDSDNLIAHPELTDEIPGWEDHFEGAIARLRGAGLNGPAGELESLYTTIKANRERKQATTGRMTSLLQIAKRRRVFDKEGSALREALGAFTYGTKPANGVLTVGQNETLFQPTHLNDHLATRFLPVAADGGGSTPMIRLRLTWPEAPSANACRFSLQDDKYNILSTVGAHAAPAPAERYYEMRADATHIRLIMTASEMETVVTPQALTIERIG